MEVSDLSWARSRASGISALNLSLKEQVSGIIGPRQIVMSRGRDLRRRRTGSLLTTLIINCKPDCTLYGSRAKTLYRITIQRFRVIQRIDHHPANCNFASINGEQTQRSAIFDHKLQHQSSGRCSELGPSSATRTIRDSRLSVQGTFSLELDLSWARSRAFGIGARLG